MTEEDFQAWRNSEATKFFFKALKHHREVMKEDHIRGLYENKEFVEGKATLLLELLEMKYEDLMEIISDKY